MYFYRLKLMAIFFLPCKLFASDFRAPIVTIPNVKTIEIPSGSTSATKGPLWGNVCGIQSQDFFNDMNRYYHMNYASTPLIEKTCQKYLGTLSKMVVKKNDKGVQFNVCEFENRKRDEAKINWVRACPGYPDFLKLIEEKDNPYAMKKVGLNVKALSHFSTELGKASTNSVCAKEARISVPGKSQTSLNEASSQAFDNWQTSMMNYQSFKATDPKDEGKFCREANQIIKEELGYDVIVPTPMEIVQKYNYDQTVKRIETFGYDYKAFDKSEDIMSYNFYSKTTAQPILSTFYVNSYSYTPSLFADTTRTKNLWWSLLDSSPNGYFSPVEKGVDKPNK